MLIRELGAGEGHDARPVLLLLPGTCCWWRGAFAGVLDGLAARFRVACVSYSGLDEADPTSTFDSLANEAEQIERMAQQMYGGAVFAAYGSSALGSALLGTLLARRSLHIERAILGSPDLPGLNPLVARAKAGGVAGTLLQMMQTGQPKNPKVAASVQAAVDDLGDYGAALMRALGVRVRERDGGFICRHTLEHMLAASLSAGLPRRMTAGGARVDALWATVPVAGGLGGLIPTAGAAAGPGGARRRLPPDVCVHEIVLRHEELLLCHPATWLETVEGILGR